MLNTKKNPYYTDRKNSSIPTPKCVIDFLYDIIPDKYKVIVLDPACGDGRLLRGKNNVGWDIEEVCRAGSNYSAMYQVVNYLKDDEVSRAIDYWAISKPTMVIANPPYNNKEKGNQLLPEEFLKQTIKFFGENQPMVLFAPLGLLANQRIHSRRWRWMRESRVKITSRISLPLDIFTPPDVMEDYTIKKKEIEKQSINRKDQLIQLKKLRRNMGVIEFHSEIICFNIPEMENHYFLPKKYLP